MSRLFSALNVRGGSWLLASALCAALGLIACSTTTNKVDGEGNQVEGGGNNVKGNNNSVTGWGNTVSGDGNSTN